MTVVEGPDELCMVLRERRRGAIAPHMVDDTSNNRLTYADAGVDIDRGARLVDRIRPHVAATRRPGADGAIGGFGGLFDLAATSYRDPVLVAANDGVGTKLRLAIEAGRHDTIGIDLVAMCVNDLVVQGAEPLFFLDYLATARLDLDRDEAIVHGIAEGCREAGCALIGGETAEMPDMYAAGDYDLAGFAVGAVERGAILPRDISEGDVLIGLPSSGIHSNGYSLVRRIVERSGASLTDPFDNATLGQTLLTPTVIYVRRILYALRAGIELHGLAHITGGGLIENVPRVLPDGLAARISLGSWTVPPIFGWLRENGPVADDEMLRTFNCGIGMVAIVTRETAATAIEALGTADAPAVPIGEIVRCTNETVTFDGVLHW